MTKSDSYGVTIITILLSCTYELVNLVADLRLANGHVVFGLRWPTENIGHDREDDSSTPAYRYQLREQINMLKLCPQTKRFTVNQGLKFS